MTKYEEDLQVQLTETLSEMWGLVGYIHSILNVHNLWSEEGTYTFQDGLTIREEVKDGEEVL